MIADMADTPTRPGVETGLVGASLSCRDVESLNQSGAITCAT